MIRQAPDIPAIRVHDVDVGGTQVTEVTPVSRLLANAIRVPSGDQVGPNQTNHHPSATGRCCHLRP